MQNTIETAATALIEARTAYRTAYETETDDYKVGILAAAYEAAAVTMGEAVRTSGRTDEKAMARLAQVTPADIRDMRLGRR